MAFWGTSSCAPQVAVVAALIKNADPCLTPVEIEDRLKTTTDPIADAGSYVGTIGTGRINAFKAVQKALTYKANFVQNQTFNAPTCTNCSSVVYGPTTIVGRTVTSSLPYGDVVLNSGANVLFTSRNYIEIKGGFEAKTGSAFILDVNPNTTACP